MNVKFVQIAALPETFDAAYKGIFVYVTGTKKLYFGGEAGWEMLSNDTDVAAIENKIKTAIEALDTTADVATASVADGVVTLTAGIAEVDGKIQKGTGSDITLAKVATTGLASDVTVAAIEGVTAEPYSVQKVLEAIVAANSAAIDNLDLTAVGGEGKVITTVSQVDGKVSATAIDLTAGAVKATATEATDTKVGVAGTSVADQISSLATSIKSEETRATAAEGAINELIGTVPENSTVMGEIAKAKAGATTTVTGETATTGPAVKVTESTDAETGAKTYAVAGQDLASAALLGTAADGKDDETAFGKIAAEADRATTAEGALDTRVTNIETLIGKDGDSDDIINKVSEVITWFDGVKETETGAALLSDVTTLKSTAGVSAGANDLDLKATGADAAVKGSDIAAIKAYVDAKATQTGTIEEHSETNVAAASSTDKVKVTVTTEDGSVKSVAVATDDIASAAQYKTDVTDKLLGAATVAGSVAEAKKAGDDAQAEINLQKDAETEGTLANQISGINTKIGAKSDAATADTVYGAIAAAKAAATTTVSGETAATGPAVKVTETENADGSKSYAVAGQDLASAAQYKTDVTDKLLGAATVTGSVAEAKKAGDDAQAEINLQKDAETEGTLAYKIAQLEAVDAVVTTATHDNSANSGVNVTVTDTNTDESSNDHTYTVAAELVWLTSLPTPAAQA